MQGANGLLDRQEELAERFASLAQARGDLPVYAIEHGLDELAREELRKTVSRALEDPRPLGTVWSRSYLPLVVIAAEVGYRYRGTGTDFWPLLAQELGIEADSAFRSGLSELFELAHSRFRMAKPGNSPWERHFPHIAWPIGNSLVPLEIQPQLAETLRRAVRAGVSPADTDRLLEHIKVLAAGHASRRFENWLLQRDVALEVMRRLLAPSSEGWLSDSFLLRIDRDIRKDRSAFRAITEARTTVMRRPARVAQVASSRYVLELVDGAPKHMLIRGPVLPAQMRSEVIATLRIHGDRIRAANGVQAIPLSSFLAGGTIPLENILPLPSSPLRRDDALDGGEEDLTMRRLQPLEAEFFIVEPNGLTAEAVFPEDKLRPKARIIQLIRADDKGDVETRTFEVSTPSDAEFLRRRGFSIVDRVPSLRLMGMPAPGRSDTFIGDFPLLVAQRGVATPELLLDGEVVADEALIINATTWRALRPDIGRHVIEPVESPELDMLNFEVVEPADVEPATIKVLPANSDVSDLEAGNLEIIVTAPLALEAVPIRIRVISPHEPVVVSEGLIERLPAKITGRSPILNEIQRQLAGTQAIISGLRLSVEVVGLLEKVVSLPPVRRELRYDRETDKWTRVGEESLALPSIRATPADPLLSAPARDWKGTILVLPDAPDHEALRAGLVLSGPDSTRLGLGERNLISLPALLREPTSTHEGVGLIETARAYVAWQLAEANSLLSNWQRWTVVEALEAALIEQLCGVRWRGLEAGIDLSILSPHGALLRCARALGLVSGGDLPEVEKTSDKEFLRDRLIVRLRQTVPDVSEALLQWNNDLAGALDLAVIDAYEDLRRDLEARRVEAFDEVDMSRPAESWRDALERSREVPLLPMFRPFILPEARWSALIRPFYGELTEDDLVDLLDATHVDAFRRPGLRWLGRSELRTMLQLWLSPKALVETDGWETLLAKGLSDIRTSRAVRYVSLRRKIALGDLPDGTAK